MAKTLGYVVLHVAERVVRAYVGQQRRVGRIAYVHAEYFVAVGEQPPAEVRADESGAAQYHDSFPIPILFGTGNCKNYSIKIAFGSWSIR